MQEGHQANSKTQKQSKHKPYRPKCSICISTFKTKQILKKHLKQKHLQMKPQKKICPVCQKPQAKLPRHLKRMHPQQLQQSQDDYAQYKRMLQEDQQELQRIQQQGPTGKQWNFQKELKKDIKELKSLLKEYQV